MMRRTALQAVGLCFLAGATVAHPGSVTALADGEVLQPGVTAEFELDVGAVQRHRLTLEAGQFVHVEVREKGPRVVVSLLDEKGSTLARREAPLEEVTALRLMAVAPASGGYTLEVRSSGEGREGRYELRMEESRLASDRERALAAADDALSEAVRLWHAGTAEATRRALSLLEAAEAGFVAAGDRQGQALALLTRGDLEPSGPNAESRMERSLSLFQELGDPEGMAAALVELGFKKTLTGEMDPARTYFERAAGYARAIDNRRLSASCLNGTGYTFSFTGEAEKAIAAYSQGLSMAAAAGSPPLQVDALIGLSFSHRALGEPQKALEYSERGLSLARAAGDRHSEVSTLCHIGTARVELGEDAAALPTLEEAYSLAEAVGDTEAEAISLNTMARILGRRGDFTAALELGQRALQSSRKDNVLKYVARSLDTLGRLLHQSGDTQAALQHLDQALRIQQATHDGYAEVRTREAIAAVERDRGDLRAALAQAEAAVALVEALRSKVTNPDLRASFVAGEQDLYGIYIDILTRLHEQDRSAGHDAAALQTSERARARVLLEALIEARADIREGVPPALLDQERALRADVSKASARLSSTLAREGAVEEAARARQELEARSEEYRLVQSRIRQESPRYAALTQPEPATVEQIRRDVLDDDTVLLEFYLGQDRSFLWALTRSALLSRALPERATIEASARKVHALTTARQRSHAPEELRTIDRQLETESAALSRLLLGAIASRLETDWKGKRLLIITSGALAYIPFGALPSPVAGVARPLLRDHEIVFAPSASVLLAQRGESRPPPLTGTRVAVVADPVFEASDPRVHFRIAAPTKPVATSIGLTRAVESLGHGFTRLPFSRAEAGAIATLVPRSSLLEATDFAASRTLVTNGALADRRILHFATHGLLDSEHPDLSGLVLSLVDEKGTAQDGFLRMQEIYNLRLPADLVVLSACQTALGREIRGEGLVGLTRGFMYAGARRVVASLWEVDDESTAELMKRFYRGMLKEGRRPADALRVAQLELSRNPRWSAPFYWAGFVLQGEWR